MRINRKKTNLVNSRWAKYAAAGAAGAFLTLGPLESVDADFTFVDVGVQMIDPVQNGSFEQFGPYSLGGAGASFYFYQRFEESSPGEGEMFILGQSNIHFAGLHLSSLYYPSNLASGDFVSAVSSFGVPCCTYGNMAWGAGNPNDQFLDPGLSFVGFRFDLGNGTQYGFAEVIMDGAPVNSGFFVGYGYGDPGESVYAGQREVPEPGTLGFLALGSVGLLAWRRKRSIPVYE